MATEILRKLTLKTVGLTVDFVKNALVKQKAEGDKPPVMHEKVELVKIIGISNSAKPGTTDKGEYLKLFGQFTAFNMITGEVFNAAQCILPDFVAGPLGAALAQSGEVQFAVMIGAKHAPTAITGYQWYVSPLIEAEPTSAMQQLAAAAGLTGMLGLPAPSDAAPAVEADGADSAPSGKSTGKKK